MCAAQMFLRPPPSLRLGRRFDLLRRRVAASRPRACSLAIAALLTVVPNLARGEAPSPEDRPAAREPSDEASLRLHWADNMLTISGPHLAGGEMAIWYLEAYCRPGSTDRDWGETVIGHRTELVSASEDGRRIELRCKLKDGVQVDHVITAGSDEVDFRIQAHNPTEKASLAHWAQPCIRVDKFTGIARGPQGQQDYLAKSFIFVDGRLSRMPVEPWATQARYTPGQTWAAPGVDRNDVNPRPLSAIVPSHGLIGCFSADESQLMAVAFEPYQELFQGVIICLHSDFRIGGLEPGESKSVRGKLYLMNNDVPRLLKRYRRDFPEQHRRSPGASQVP